MHQEEYVFEAKKSNKPITGVMTVVFVLLFIFLAVLLLGYLPNHISQSNNVPSLAKPVVNNSSYYEGGTPDMAIELEVVNKVATLSVSSLALENNQVALETYEIPSSQAKSLVLLPDKNYEVIVPQGGAILQPSNNLVYQNSLADLRQLAASINASMTPNYSLVDISSNLVQDISNANQLVSSTATTSTALSQAISSSRADLYLYLGDTKIHQNLSLVKSVNGAIAKEQAQLDLLLAKS